VKFVFLRTPIVNLKNSPFGSTPGIPANLPYLAAVLMKEGHAVGIVDAFGGLADDPLIERHFDVAWIKTLHPRAADLCRGLDRGEVLGPEPRLGAPGPDTFDPDRHPR